MTNDAPKVDVRAFCLFCGEICASFGSSDVAADAYEPASAVSDAAAGPRAVCSDARRSMASPSLFNSSSFATYTLFFSSSPSSYSQFYMYRKRQTSITMRRELSLSCTTQLEV